MPIKGIKPKYSINLKKQTAIPTEVIAQGAFVLELTMEGEGEVTINGEQSYPITSNGKETIYIGQRFFNHSIPNIELKGKQAKIKKMKLKIWSL